MRSTTDYIFDNRSAQARYDDANTIQVKLKLNKKTDADIIKFPEGSS